MRSGGIRSVAVLSVGALMAGTVVLAGPAHARGCKSYKPVAPASDSSQADEALDAKVIKVTSKATKKKPIVVEFSHGPGFWSVDGTAVIEDSVFFNLQVLDSAKKLGVQTEWAAIGGRSKSDIDLYLYDSNGAQVADSTTFNPEPALNPSTGGPNFELISFPAFKCEGFSVESRVFWGGLEDMTLKLWLQ